MDFDMTVLSSPLDCPEKTTQKWSLSCQNPPIGSKVTVIFHFCQLFCTIQHCFATIFGLPKKNYPKVIPVMSKSIHGIKSYNKISFYVSWFIQIYRGFVLIIRQPLKTQKCPLQVEFYPSLVFKCHLKETKPYQTKPNQLQPYTNILNVFLNPFTLEM